MDSIDLDLLRYMAERDNYYELRGVIDKSLCVKESWELINDFGEYYKARPDATKIDDDFKLWQRVERHPNWKPEQQVQKLKQRLVAFGHSHVKAPTTPSSRSTLVTWLLNQRGVVTIGGWRISTEASDLLGRETLL